MPERSFSISLDSGCQKFFVPLQKPETFSDPTDFPFDLPQSLTDALKDIQEIEDNQCISEETRLELESIFHGGIEKNPWQEIKPFIRMRFGKKTWHFKDGLETTLNGIWLAFETNTSAQNENEGGEEYDRGYFYQTSVLSDDERAMFLDQKSNNQALTRGESKYISKEDSVAYTVYPFAIPNPNGGTISFTNLNFFYEVKEAGGKTDNVDVILDLGNTRTAGLLFSHTPEGRDFPPRDFRKYFKVLRLKPDPFSGEYDSVDDVDAGIAPSWIVLHELEHQTYWPPNPQMRPPDVPLLQKQYCVTVTPGKAGFLGVGKTPPEVKGNVCLRVPQMFTQLSPVLMGDQAERSFNLPYARNLIQVGARIQQSSPKRYYWDDAPVNVYWNMLLNEWDPLYEDHPRAHLPKIQGEMFRFIREDGKILDLSGAREPSQEPQPHPMTPAYPRQSTLTWTLLHILERAYSQTNTTFAAGADFIPHRLSKVLITYPSGWTNDEVKRYRERCQEAVDIFTQANIYRNCPVKLVLVPQNKTPDEAVAGQLPFIFSEIIRYPGMSAAGWISIAGKRRKVVDPVTKRETGEKRNTVRIMNFDIGGGTTDISVIEYKDENKQRGVSLNILSTTLLFKDGKALAGDDILKGVIENIILKGLIKNSGNPVLKERLVDYFSAAMNNPAKEYIRSRIVRTCLIPLATKCLSASGAQMVDFSPQDAGINENNWREFCTVLVNNPTAISYDEKCVHFTPEDLNAIVEPLFKYLFQNCAMYAAAYDIDMLIFSGKPSELPVIRDMAKKYIPIDDGRIIFARDFKPGEWYPFTDKNGFIEDAKTVTVVGAALYYALSSGLIANWTIQQEKVDHVEPNEWGQLELPDEPFLPKNEKEATISIMPNLIIARRQNACSSQEPVYRFVKKAGHGNESGPELVSVTFERQEEDDVEFIKIKAINGVDYDPATSDYELILWPCADANGFSFWQETGMFSGLRDYLE